MLWLCWQTEIHLLTWVLNFCDGIRSLSGRPGVVQHQHQHLLPVLEGSQPASVSAFQPTPSSRTSVSAQSRQSTSALFSPKILSFFCLSVCPSFVCLSLCLCVCLLANSLA